MNDEPIGPFYSPAQCRGYAKQCKNQTKALSWLALADAIEQDIRDVMRNRRFLEMLKRKGKIEYRSDLTFSFRLPKRPPSKKREAR